MIQRTVAILGGSFDPPHIAHLETVKSVKNLVDEVWVIPCGYRDDKPLLTNYDARLELCKLAFADVHVSDYEKGKPMIPTYSLLSQLKQDFQNIKFFFIIGSDLLDSLHTWNFAENLIQEIDFLVLFRGGFTNNEGVRETYLSRKNFQVIKSDFISDISSTYLRKLIGNTLHENISQESKVSKINECLRISMVSEFIVANNLYSSYYTPIQNNLN